ncbi:hypothetical protein F442_02315 [Phytophthora nicotianae P10297]|uniref:ABC transmembrane type-1 domain-containing protein n=3 Tax=Phytophthora nicotianae TaxID=4792 RepID=V9FX11_PHYNI|nr:hypothetical protein F443_02344 [Phytophthora nicotianae P1569]ETO83678.1 hypothetical protein F444_02341 [Phytophthora nicotianae P1976]ETP52723.1 hypothetical protein F442_02315 [Phytophthora nicotianae P10297]
MDSEVTTASTLVILPWSFKVFYSILSDCVPLWGYRRKVWMLVGWAMCLTMLIVMAASPAGDPYYTVPSDRGIDPADYTPEIEARINFDAGSQAGKYVMLMLFAAIGYVLVDREPVEKRGTIQSAIYAVRTVFVIIGQLLVGFCFNSEAYGGQFDFSLNFPLLMTIVAVITAPIIPITWFFIKEEKQSKVSFRKYMSELWNLIQKRAVYQNVFSNISYTASSPVQSYKVGVTPINNTISEIISNVLFMGGIMATSKWGMHWSWRKMILCTGIFVILADGITTFLTIWNLFRSQ